MKSSNKLSLGSFLWNVKTFVSLFLFFIFILNSAYAGNPVTVVYPVFHNNTDRIISEIRSGISESQKNNVAEIAFDPVIKNNSIQKKISSLTKEDIVITLTSNLGNIVRTSGFKGQIIEGISDNLLTTDSTVSVGIMPSPGAFVGSLTKLQPKIRKIYYFIVRNGVESEQEKDKILLVAKVRQIDMDPIVVEDINDVMHKLSNVLDKCDPSKDALWISDNILAMANNTVLKYVLREAWRKSLIVFTDSLDAVTRGLLFSVVPDYLAYGKYLGQISKELAVRDDLPVSESIEYFDDIYLMINQRFLIHAGLNINRSLVNKYKIVVPAK